LSLVLYVWTDGSQPLGGTSGALPPGSALVCWWRNGCGVPGRRRPAAPPRRPATRCRAATPHPPGTIGVQHVAGIGRPPHLPDPPAVLVPGRDGSE
jgi:hypothetical protein